jgi:hypothetical protein
VSDTGKIRAFVDQYYTGKLRQYGETPNGVDWNSAESQNIRFAQILSICDGADKYTLNDIGCGYGALVDALPLRRPSRYTGYDLSSAMVHAASRRYFGREDLAFTSNEAEVPIADFTVASGIFSVKGDISDQDWWDYCIETIAFMRKRSKRGFAFNMLTAYSDVDRMRSNLFYADPLATFSHCRTTFSPWVALLHDYGLYEFTIRVRLQ